MTMTGRGPRGGRGRFHNRNNNRNSGSNRTNKHQKGYDQSKSKPSKRKYLFHPNGHSSPNFYAFSETLSHIVATLRADTEWSSAQEVIDAVKHLEDRRPPMPTKPTKIQPAPVKDQPPGEPYYDELLLAEYKTDHAEWKKKVVGYDNKFKTAAGVVFQKYCTNEMRGKLEGQPDFSTDLEQNPVALLLRIRSLCQQGTAHEQLFLKVLKQYRRTFDK